MKKLVLLTLIPAFVAVMLLSSCSETKRRQKRAEKLASEYVKENLRSGRQYRAIEFSNLVLDSTVYVLNDSVGMELNARLSRLADDMMNTSTLMKQATSKDLIMIMANQLAALRVEHDSLLRVITINAEAFRRVPNGWVMRHRYSIPDEAGRTVQQTMLFTFDLDVTKVVSSRLE